MDSTTTTKNKKKKRRTRKCLNEIRKRSRSTKCSEYFGQTSHLQPNNTSKVEEYQSHRLITMNRLTINMFPKVIRSETITRPLLQEIKQKSLLNCQDTNKLNIRSSDSNTPPRNCKAQSFEQSNSVASKSIMPMFDLEDEIQQEYVSSHSPNMHVSHIDIMETPTKPLPTIFTTSSSQSSHASDGDHSRILYDELMNEISSHLNNITTTVIKEDIMRGTKISLQKLISKNRNRSCNISLNKEFNNIQSPKDPIVQNPLDYIRHSHVEQQGVCEYQCSRGAEGDGTSAAPSPLPSPSPSPNTRALSAPTACNVALYDTPEYNYYPHKLN